MRLIREMPEAEALFEQGALTLETMHQVHSHFKSERPTEVEKKEILKAVEHKSKAEVKRLLKPESRTSTVKLSQEVMEKLEKLETLMATSDLERIIERLADQALKTAPPAEQKEVKGSATRYVPESLKRAVYQLTHLFLVHSLTHSLPHSLTHSHTPSHTRSPTLPLSL